MEKGIIIIGAGDPYYGRLAINLASSIRNTDSELPILIYTTPLTIKPETVAMAQRNNITIELLPEGYYKTETGNNFFKPKTYLYDLSPFNKTICLDADMLWLPSVKPQRVFDELSKFGFTASNEGYVDVKSGVSHTTGWYQFWAEYEDIVAAYGKRLKDKFYQLRTEFIYFEKSKANKRLFSLSQKIYEERRVSHSAIAGVVPDELSLNIASSILGIYPHKDRYCPAYWWFRRKRMKEGQMNIFDIQFRYPLLSIGGNKQEESILKFYNARAEVYAKKIGFRGYLPIRNKAEVLSERKLI